jgi:PAS domain S-box-containing protein
MAWRALADRDPRNGVWVFRTKGPAQRVAPAAADLHGNGRGNGGNNGAAAGHVVEERGRAEAALALAASIVESSDDAIVGKTLDGMITSWNAGAERLYGYTAREVIGRWPIGITIPEDELPKILERVGRGERVEHYETVWVRKDGRRVDVSVTVSPIRDTHGTIVGASSIARDITHRKEAEAAIRERDTLRSVASLAAAAAHEINNPLAAAMGHIHLLADGVDAKARRRIDEILDALSRIQEIIIRMTQITRLELTEQAPYLPEMLDLSRSSELGSPDKEQT